MRKLLTGLDQAGRSRLVKETELHPAGAASLTTKVAIVYATGATLEPAPPATDVGVLLTSLGAEGAKWMVVEWAPNSFNEMHHTNTLDFDLVLAGSGEMELEDGVHPIGEGDFIVMTGVNHAWRAGPDGLRMSVAAVAIPPAP